LLGEKVLVFMDVEFGAKKGVDVVLVLVFVVLSEASSKKSLLITGETELDDGLVVVDVDVVLLEGKVNRGAELLRVELEEIASLLVDDEVDAAADLLELTIDDEVEIAAVLLELASDDEVDIAADLLELAIDDEIDNTVLDLLELATSDEVDTVVNLLELTIVVDLGWVLVLAEDLAVLEAHAFVFGVYNGPSDGYALDDTVSDALVVVF
jgi:hypothetical protein